MLQETQKKSVYATGNRLKTFMLQEIKIFYFLQILTTLILYYICYHRILRTTEGILIFLKNKKVMIILIFLKTYTN